MVGISSQEKAYLKKNQMISNSYDFLKNKKLLVQFLSKCVFLYYFTVHCILCILYDSFFYFEFIYKCDKMMQLMIIIYLFHMHKIEQNQTSFSTVIIGLLLISNKEKKKKIHMHFNISFQ